MNKALLFTAAGGALLSFFVLTCVNTRRRTLLSFSLTYSLHSIPDGLLTQAIVGVYLAAR